MTFVVDTNVPIAANGRQTHADERCQLACVQRLRSLAAGDTVAIDRAGLILNEYKKHLHFSGIPGVGDMFFKHVFNNQSQSKYVRRVAVTPTGDPARGFEELPKNTFDPSDRKFLAVAVAAQAVVLNATDSDWGEHGALTSKLGVEVRELCPQHVSRPVSRGRRS